MTLNSSFLRPDAGAINRGFSKQSADYDATDRNNPVLQDLRNQVYHHVEKFLRPHSHILEINAGTGIDAMHFVSQGHRVHATDISDGMIGQIKRKIELNHLSHRLTCQQLSFTDLDQVVVRDFDYVFSNFGGLNCLGDLTLMTRHLPLLLKEGAYITLVIMPPVSPWELLSVLNGNWRSAFRRLSKNGVLAHVENEYLQTYYHSVSSICSAFGHSFKLIALEGLAAVSPPPYRRDIAIRHPGRYGLLRKLDRLLVKAFPFNLCADHVIATFHYKR